MIHQFVNCPNPATKLIAHFFVAILCLSCNPTIKKQSYNVIFFLVDDMGYADIGPYGNTYHKTPHLDQLAVEGMLFTDAYAAAPNCSPTRGSILSGKWPARTAITQYLPGNVLPFAKLLQPDLPKGLAVEEGVIAKPLQAAGYKTASIGKWHLGGGTYGPEAHGFDVSFAGGHWNAHESMFAPHPYVAVPKEKDGDYLTDRLTEESLQFIDANRANPFFLYLPYYAIHSPIEAKEELIDGYENRDDPSDRNNATYAAMVEGVDQSVGRILDQIELLGLTEKTVVFFFSDNGGVPSRAFNGPFRSGKGFLWEGGIRVPLIVKWPGVTPAGSRSNTPVTSVDFYPTILDLAGVSDVPGHTSDGESLVPLLNQSGALQREAIFWHYPHYSNAGAKPTGAIRKDQWKLIEFFEEDRVALYNLQADPAESEDLSTSNPILADSLRMSLEAWRMEVRARPALQNPAFDPEKASTRRGYRYKPRWDEAQPLRNPDAGELVSGQ